METESELEAERDLFQLIYNLCGQILVPVCFLFFDIITSKMLTASCNSPKVPPPHNHPTKWCFDNNLLHAWCACLYLWDRLLSPLMQLFEWLGGQKGFWSSERWWWSRWCSTLFWSVQYGKDYNKGTLPGRIQIISFSFCSQSKDMWVGWTACPICSQLWVWLILCLLALWWTGDLHRMFLLFSVSCHGLQPYAHLWPWKKKKT